LETLLVTKEKPMFMTVSEWVMDRIKEPSSWAAGAAVLVGLSAFLGQPWVGAAGIAAAVIAVVVKERGGRF
jgi:hypothetical protein